MPKRSRVRARPRRPFERRESDGAPDEPAPVRARARGAPAVGPSGAVGRPSAALERAAAAERQHVIKDSRRLGLVIAVMVALLVLSGFAANALLP